MTTEAKTFYCSATDWYMGRAYSDFPLAYDKSKNVRRDWYIPPLVVFVGSAIGSIIYMHWIWIVSILGCFPLFLICYQRQYTAFYNDLMEKYQFVAPTQKQIPFISVNENQLVCHFFKPDGSISHYIKLAEIDGIAIGTLSYNLNKFKLPILINKKAKQFGAEVIPELWNDQNYYILWIYTRSKVMMRNRLAIPRDWFNDARFASFLDEIEQKTGKQLQLDHAHQAEVFVIKYLQHYTSRLHK